MPDRIDADELARQLQGHAAKLEELEGTVGYLLGQATAKPYLHEPPFGLMPDPSGMGRPVLGFSGRGGVADADAYRVFEDLFRGTAERVQSLQRPYLRFLRDRGPVLDVGCGRGEFLALLRDEGTDARGVDVDAGMVAASAADGHDVTRADVADYLSAQPDDSLGAIFAAQVIEHLPYPVFREYLQLSLVKLRPGGVWIAETVNPHRPASLKCFWTDLTHQHPIFPEAALAYCWIAGFDSAHLFFPTGTGDAEVDLQDADAYAVVAYKETASPGKAC